MLKNTIFIILVYISAYFTHVSLNIALFDINSRPSYLFDSYPIFLLCILIFSIGFYNFRRSYSFLLVTFIIILTIGLIEHDFYINYMDSCPICGFSDSSCLDDCDGKCYGWYTFENERSWLVFSYMIFWLIFSSIFLVIKKVFTKRIK
jgi:hypothetical protein